MPLSTTFHLKQNENLLAVLEGCEPSWEMFWQVCNFKPTATFAEYEALFYEASNTEDDEVFEQIYDRLQTFGVVLIDVKQTQKLLTSFCILTGIKLACAMLLRKISSEDMRFPHRH